MKFWSDVTNNSSYYLTKQVLLECYFIKSSKFKKYSENIFPNLTSQGFVELPV